MGALIKSTWGGKDYSLDVDSITAREFKSIKSNTGLKAGQFLKGLSGADDLDGDAAVALLWLFQKRAGETASFDEDLSLIPFLASISDGDVAEDEEDPKAE